MGIHRSNRLTFRSLSRYVAVACLSIVTVGVIGAEAYDIDTTRTRDPRPPELPLSTKLARVPSTILYAPFWVLEQATYGLVWLGYEQQFGKQIIEGILDPTLPVVPIISYSGREGFAGGLGFRLRDIATSGDEWRLAGSYSQYNYASVLAEASFGRRNRQPFQLVISGRYTKNTREPFFGIGNGSQQRDEVNFTLETTTLEADARFVLSQSLTVLGNAGYAAHNLGDGEDDDFVSDLDAIIDTFGLATEDIASTRYLFGGLGLQLNWENQPFRPTTGGQIRAQTLYHQGVARSDNLQYFRTHVELYQRIQFFRERVFTLLVEANSIDVVDPTENEEPPFYLESSLGGNAGLYGYEPERFIDKESLRGLIEYSYPIWDILDGFLFYEQGRVFSSFTNDFSWRNWRFSWGGGIRLWGADGVIATMRISTSQETTRFAFQLGAGL